MNRLRLPNGTRIYFSPMGSSDPLRGADQMADLRVFLTNCCNFKFIGMNHSPEYEGKCRHCKSDWNGERIK